MILQHFIFLLIKFTRPSAPKAAPSLKSADGILPSLIGLAPPKQKQALIFARLNLHKRLPPLKPTFGHLSAS
jgi:hypothetical protein